MWNLILPVFVFLIIIYVYSFLEIRKNKRKRSGEKSYVDQYHEQLQKYQNHSASYRNNKTGGYTPYVTKYNSDRDYIEK